MYRQSLVFLSRCNKKQAQQGRGVYGAEEGRQWKQSGSQLSPDFETSIWWMQQGREPSTKMACILKVLVLAEGSGRDRYMKGSNLREVEWHFGQTSVDFSRPCICSKKPSRLQPLTEVSGALHQLDIKVKGWILLLTGVCQSHRSHATAGNRLKGNAYQRNVCGTGVMEPTQPAQAGGKLLNVLWRGCHKIRRKATYSGNFCVKNEQHQCPEAKAGPGRSR